MDRLKTTSILPCEMEASRLLLLGLLKLPGSEKCWYRTLKKSTTCTSDSCVLPTHPRISQNHPRDYKSSVYVQWSSNHNTNLFAIITSALYVIVRTNQSSSSLALLASTYINDAAASLLLMWISCCIKKIKWGAGVIYLTNISALSPFSTLTDTVVSVTGSKHFSSHLQLICSGDEAQLRPRVY